MSVPHLVQVGLMGTVGPFISADSSSYPRDTRVICRTERGLEQGTVICTLSESELAQLGPDSDASCDRKILRRVTPDDQLILDRLEKHRDRAFTACQQLLAENGLPGVLVDVEHLFDGESVYFYFLGDVDPATESVTAQLAATYEQKVRFKKFAETLAAGCGPDCGTKEGSCGSSGCGSCALAGKCR